MEMFPRKIILFLFLTTLLSGILYKDSFSAYFFQDDWFTLRISQALAFQEILSFFIPRTDVIYYRPLGMQVPFFLLQSIFGANPLLFHFATFVTHSINIVLVFILVRLLLNRLRPALLISFFYGTSVVHFTPFYWLATYAFVAGPTAFFVSFIWYLLYWKKRIRRYYVFSFFSFIVGLLINEMIIVLPVILFLYQVMYQRKFMVLHLIPYFFAVGFLFLTRFFLFPPPLSGDYSMATSVNILHGLKGYVLWSLQWPEEMKAQFINFYTINPQFIADFPWYFAVFALSFVVLMVFLIVFSAISLFYSNSARELRIGVFGLTWFIAGFLPVLFFPTHAFSYYVPIPLVGLLIVSRGMMQNHFATYIVIVVWLVCGFTAIDFNEKVHWAPRRAKQSKHLIEKAKQYYPISKEHLVIYVTGTSENKLSLNDQDAFRIIYNNPEIITVYTHESQNHEVL